MWNTLKWKHRSRQKGQRKSSIRPLASPPVLKYLGTGTGPGNGRIPHKPVDMSTKHHQSRAVLSCWRKQASHPDSGPLYLEQLNSHCRRSSSSKQFRAAIEDWSCKNQGCCCSVTLQCAHSQEEDGLRVFITPHVCKTMHKSRRCS